MADYSQLMNLEKKGKAQPSPVFQPKSVPASHNASEDPKGERIKTSPIRPELSLSQAAPRSEQANPRTGERLNGKRITTQESFDIYEDQMASLREISYLEKRDGKLGSMSAMVREALDTYLAKRASEK